VEHVTPRILLVDMGDELHELLSESGYNVEGGSFGFPYEVKDKTGIMPIYLNHRLPSNLDEFDVVVADLSPSSVLEKPEGQTSFDDKGRGFIIDVSHKSFVDTRGYVANALQRSFDRILSGGGVFCIFAEPVIPLEITYAQNVNRGYNEIEVSKVVQWEFLNVLKYISMRPKSGTIIDAIDAGWASKLLLKFMKDAEFSAVLGCPSHLKENWLDLAKNKHGECVAAAILQKTERDNIYSLILILPQLQDEMKQGLVLELIQDYLPEFAPHLFDSTETTHWLHDAQYELPEILDLSTKVGKLREETQQQIKILEDEIQSIREEKAYVQSLLTKQGDELVLAVEKAMRVLGFQNVINADNELEAQGIGAVKYEDLRIEDTLPWLLLEIKGLAELPKEADVFQLQRHLFHRSKQLKQTDLKGLSIINHQRNRHPLERSTAFQEQFVTYAIEHEIGLMTTWTLWRLLRGVFYLNWSKETIKPLFYQNGVIEPIPTHYCYLGIITEVLKKANAFIIILEDDLPKDSRIAIDIWSDFIEDKPNSIRKNDISVEFASKGDEIGIAASYIERIKKGMKLYLVKA
jgi:hypothetical protein